MSFAGLASAYLSAHFIACVAGVFFLLLGRLLAAARLELPPGRELRLHYGTLLALPVILSLLPLLPPKEIFPPIAKVWAASSAKAFTADYQNSGSGYLSFPAHGKLVPAAPAGAAGLWLAAAALAIGALRLAKGLRWLRRARARACLVRRIGRLRVCVSGELPVPLSFWLPGQRVVVLPQSLIGRPGFRIALLHELQHHRQMDTIYVYILWALRLLLAANPCVYWWSSRISELQEFACDEALVGQRKVEPRAYARCLLEVAQNVNGRAGIPACATGLFFPAGHSTLRRRIENMLKEKNNVLGARAAWLIAAVVAAVLGTAAYASQGMVQDRRVTMAQAREMAGALKGSPGFPVVVNEQVVRWLNYFTGTPEGRAKVREALERMAAYRPVIEKRMEQYRAPRELLAIPLIESGYRNLEPGQNPVRAAGLWQFIASTARNFGLRVDNTVDERMDVGLETDAALRLLLGNRLRFNDWQLSILAYNSGERYIQGLITRTGSRDPWVLIKAGMESEENREYLPKFMAGLLLLGSPAAAQE